MIVKTLLYLLSLLLGGNMKRTGKYIYQSIKPSPAFSQEQDAHFIEIGFEIRIEGFDVSDKKLSRELLCRLYSFVESDPCLPKILSSKVESVDIDGFSYRKPNGEIIIDCIREGASAYTTAPFYFGNFDRWLKHTSLRLKEYFPEAHLKKYVSIDSYADAASTVFSDAKIQKELSSGVVKMFSNGFSFCALKTDGSVIAWGDAKRGGDSCCPTGGDLSSGVKEIISNSESFAALKHDGSVVAWGNPEAGGDVSHGTSLSLESGVVKIIPLTESYGAFKDDGSLVLWGRTLDSDSIEQLGSGVVKILSDYRSFTALRSNGELIRWSNSNWNETKKEKIFGDLSNYFVDVHGYRGWYLAKQRDSGITVIGLDTEIAEKVAKGIKKVVVNSYATAALLIDDSVIAWGATKSWGGDTSLGSSGDLTSGVIDIIPNNTSFAAVKSDGSVVTWGHPEKGGDIEYNRIGDLTSGVAKIVSGCDMYVALMKDGSLVKWGAPHRSSEKGFPETILRSGVKDILTTKSTYDSKILAFKEDGSVVFWGYDEDGTIEPKHSLSFDDKYSINQSSFLVNKNDGSSFYFGQRFGRRDVSKESDGRLVLRVLSIEINERAFAALTEAGEVVTWGQPDGGGSKGVRFVEDM